MESKGLESQLFKWESWDEVSVGSFTFYDVTLVRQLGSHPVGSRFDAAYFSMEESRLSLIKNGSEYAFHLNLEAIPLGETNGTDKK